MMTARAGADRVVDRAAGCAVGCAVGCAGDRVEIQMGSTWRSEKFVGLTECQSPGQHTTRPLQRPSGQQVARLICLWSAWAGRDAGELARAPYGLTCFPMTENSMQAQAARHGETAAGPRAAGSTAAGLGMALGWVSVGLGVAALLRPRTLTQAAGVGSGRRVTRTMRAIGARELTTGAGLLMQPRQTGWLWARAAGDVIDLGLLAAAGRQRRYRSERIAMASALVAGLTVLDVLSAWDRQRQSQSGQPAGAVPGTVHVRQSLNINRSPETCYRFWRDFANFPNFMQHVDEVRMLDATRSHWKVRAPLGRQVEWTAELVSDVPSQQLGWRTVDDAAITHAGVVRFAPGTGGRGTRIQVDLDYAAPLGKAGMRLAQLLGEEPSLQVAQDLRRFKQLIETGEIPTTAGQPAGRRSLLTQAMHKERTA